MVWNQAGTQIEIPYDLQVLYTFSLSGRSVLVLSSDQRLALAFKPDFETGSFSSMYSTVSNLPGDTCNPTPVITYRETILCWERCEVQQPILALQYSRCVIIQRKGGSHAKCSMFSFLSVPILDVKACQF